MAPEINDNETMPQPVGAPLGQILDDEPWRRSTGQVPPGDEGAGRVEGRPLQSGTEGSAGVPNQSGWTHGPDAEGVPKAQSHRRMARAAAEAPPYGQAPGPGGDGVRDFGEQLENGGPGLPPAWPAGETAAEIRARMSPRPSPPQQSRP